MLGGMSMIRGFASLVVCVFWALYGQSTAAQRFEVASVKPSPADQGNGNSGAKSGSGRLTMTNVTLKRCIIGAYGVGPNQILGGPDWLDSDRYEIVAKADQPVGDGMLMTMLQTLLAERFKLAIHRETRPIQAYVLEVAKNGPKLEKAPDEASTTGNGHGLIDARAIAMTRFATVLARQMDAPVVDRTGLEGKFNLKLEWTPESDKPLKPGTDAAAMDSGLSIFTAIQQQLGLRLRPQKVPIEIIVIDHAERPSEN
jgi:uncharacterized protein (TIGR03435 family)